MTVETVVEDNFLGKVANTITINLSKIINLVGSKSDTWNLIVKAEYMDKQLAESAKTEVNKTETCLLNFNSEIHFQNYSPKDMDDICNNPVLLKFIEVLPKEKKQKEEKTLLLYQCTLDLVKFVSQGVLELMVNCPIHKVDMINIPADGKIVDCPTAEFHISVRESMLQKPDIDGNGTVISFTCESLYSIPDVWNSSTLNYIYVAAFPLSCYTNEKENTLIFSEGQLEQPLVNSDKCLQNKRWFSMNGKLVGNSIFKHNNFLSDCSIIDSTGDLKSPQDLAFREEVEKDKQHIRWNQEQCVYLKTETTKEFADNVAKYRIFPLEVFRITAPSTGKGNRKEEEGHISYHGVVYVNMTPLLYPGVKSIKGCYKVEAYNEEEYLKKTNRKTVIDTTSKYVNGLMSRNNNSPFPKSKKDKQAVKEGTKNTSKINDVSEDVSVNVEGQAYNESKSYISIDVQLNFPLVKKKTAENIKMEICKVIPNRPLYPHELDDSEKSLKNFENQIKLIADQILEEYSTLLNDDKTRENKSIDAIEERRQNILYVMNASGKYNAFREQLKYTIVNVVRHTFGQKTKIKDENEFHSFVSRLHVYLVDKMHKALNETLSIEKSVAVVESVTTSDQLKLFAEESENEQNYEMAAFYHQERVARNNNDRDAWFDQGIYLHHRNELLQAEFCFKQTLACDKNYIMGILMYAITLYELGDFIKSGTFFEAATNFHDKDVFVWLIQALFFESICDDIGTEMSMTYAKRLISATDKNATIERNISSARSNLSTSSTRPKRVSILSNHSNHDNSKSSTPKSQTLLKSHDKKTVKPASELSKPTEPIETKPQHVKQSMFLKVANKLLPLKAASFVEKALSHFLIENDGEESIEYLVCLGDYYLLMNNFSKANEIFTRAVSVMYQNANIWAKLGHTLYMMKNYNAAKDCYERTVALVDEPHDVRIIYMRLGDIYLDEEDYESSKSIYLKACQLAPSSLSWLGVGISCYRLAHYDDSELALCEANILNNNNAEIWAYLSLVALRTNKRIEAEKSFKYTIKLNLNKQHILDEIKQLQKELNFGNTLKEMPNLEIES